MFLPSVLSGPVAARVPAIVMGDSSGGVRTVSVHDATAAAKRRVAAGLAMAPGLHPVIGAFLVGVRSLRGAGASVVIQHLLN